MQEELYKRRVLEIERSLSGKNAFILMTDHESSRNLNGRLCALGLASSLPPFSFESKVTPSVIIVDEDTQTSK